MGRGGWWSTRRAPYPGKELLEYLKDSFNLLKREQVRLLKALTANKAYPLAQTTPSVALISDTWRSHEAGTRTSPDSVSEQSPLREDSL